MILQILKDAVELTLILQNIGNASPRLFITFQYNLDGSPTLQNLFQNANAVVYGVKGAASNIPATVCDPSMVIENSSIGFNTNINFNNHLLQNVVTSNQSLTGLINDILMI